VNLDPSAFVADPELIRELELASTPLDCPEERVLFRQGEAPQGLYILRTGKATLTMDSPSGEQLITSNASAGSLLGLPGLIGNEPYTLTAVASAGSELSLLSRDSFTSLMRTNPLLALKVLQVLAAEVRSARSAILQR
jgi:CRP-like cAMP-binding protein